MPSQGSFVAAPQQQPSAAVVYGRQQGAHVIHGMHPQQPPPPRTVVYGQQQGVVLAQHQQTQVVPEPSVSRQPSPDVDPYAIYVGNLSRGVDTNDLRTVFRRFGPIANVSFSRNFKRQSSGMACECRSSISVSCGTK